MQAAGADRVYSLLHEAKPYHDGTFKSWAEKASVSHPFHYSDGVTVFAAESDLNPEDKFLSDPDD